MAKKSSNRTVTAPAARAITPAVIARPIPMPAPRMTQVESSERKTAATFGTRAGLGVVQRGADRKGEAKVGAATRAWIGPDAPVHHIEDPSAYGEAKADP